MRNEGMKEIKRLLAGCLLFLFAFLAVPAVNAQAAVKQTAETKTTVTVSWDAAPVETVTKYTVYVGTDSSDLKAYGSVSGSRQSKKIKGLTAGMKYYVRVTYDYVSAYGTARTDCLLANLYVKTLPGKVTNLKQDRWWYFINQFDVSWDRQTGVDGYEYVVKNSKGKKIASGQTTASYRNKTSVEQISNTMIYTVRVRSFAAIDGTLYYGGWSDPIDCFTQPRITSAKVSDGKLTVKWDKVTGATKYVVYVSAREQTGYKKAATVSADKNSVTLTKFKNKKFSSNKTYYVYVVTKKGSSTSGKLYYWNTKDTGYDYFQA